MPSHSTIPDRSPTVQVNIKNLIDDVQCYQTVRELRWPNGIECPGRSYWFGDKAKSNKASKRPLTQASLRCTRWWKPSSLHRIPTPLKRCWMSHLQALSTIPDPRGNPSSLYVA